VLNVDEHTDLKIGRRGPQHDLFPSSRFLSPGCYLILWFVCVTVEGGAGGAGGGAGGGGGGKKVKPILTPDAGKLIYTSLFSLKFI